MKHLNDLTDKQFALAVRAFSHPVILICRGECITAASLARHGYGTVEDGASGERIFRLNPEASDMVADEQELWRGKW